MKVWIYGLTDNDVVFYVGQSDNMAQRMCEHRCDSKRKTDRKALRIRSIVKEGRNLDYIILDSCDSSISYNREIYWIQKYLNDGFALTNTYSRINTHLSARPDLSDRQLMILQHLANDLSPKQIAPLLQCSVRTVEALRIKANEILGVHTMGGLISKAYKKGLIH